MKEFGFLIHQIQSAVFFGGFPKLELLFLNETLEKIK
jgi:hypothetical protein